MLKFCKFVFAAATVCALAACNKVDSSATAAPQTAGMGAGGMGGGGRVTAVVVETVKLSSFVDETEALGTAKSNEAVDITAKTTNRVVAVHFREGEMVKEGTVLVELDSHEASANLASAQATLRDTQSQYQRSRELYRSKALSEADLIQLEAKMLSSQAAVDASQSRVDDTVIKAPFSGRMGLRNVSVGSLVTPGQIISTLDDTSVIKLDFTMPESYLATIKEGQQVEAKSVAFIGESFRGRVSSISTRVDPVSRSVIVRALIDNRDQKLKPGMFMTVHLTKSQGNVLMVPEQALMPEGERQFVYTINGDVATKVRVSTGRRKPGMVEISEGLKAGDRLVVEGGEKLSNGARVEVSGAPRVAES